MKIEQDKTFSPITITLETREDVRDFSLIINSFIQTHPSARAMQDELSLWLENVAKL